MDYGHRSSDNIYIRSRYLRYLLYSNLLLCCARIQLLQFDLSSSEHIESSFLYLYLKKILQLRAQNQLIRFLSWEMVLQRGLDQYPMTFQNSSNLRHRGPLFSCFASLSMNFFSLIALT